MQPRQQFFPLGRFLSEAADRLTAKFRQADIAIFHEFASPPYGGGNQFLLALRRQLEELGWRTEVNAISKTDRKSVV